MKNKGENSSKKVATYFENWAQKTQQGKKIEYLNAINSFRERNSIFRPFLRLVINNDDIFDKSQFIHLFDALEPLNQFLLVKNMLIIGRHANSFFGMIGDDLFTGIKHSLLTILPRFTEKQRSTLAKIDMERNGVTVLEHYNLPEGIELELTNLAKKNVQACMPPYSEEFVTDCVKNQNLEALQLYVFRQLSGRYRVSLGYEKNSIAEEIHKKLDGVNSNSVPELLEAINRAKEAQALSFLNNGWFQYPTLSSERPPHWGSDITSNRKTAVASDKLVEFSYGGGFFYVLDFLTKKTKGYALEGWSKGIGIQVSPGSHYHARDVIYSEASHTHFDYPVRLSGTIKAEYLDQAVNDYEAGLRNEYVDYLQDIVITRLDTGITYKIGTIDNKKAFPEVGIDHDKGNETNCVVS